MTSLLDVSVLIALLDPSHVFHDKARNWFIARTDFWATCPITENGLLRILGDPRYRNSPGSPEDVARLLARLRQVHGHVFWADDISLTNVDALTLSRVSPAHVTDVYLLALATAHGGELVTLDARLNAAALTGSEKHFRILP